MPKLYKYKKLTDEYTTYTAVDKGEEDKRLTELCTIGDDTYISVPDDLTLPEQPKEITLEPVIITSELKGQIEKASPHMQLIKKRIKDKIAEKYSIEDELKIIRNKINGMDVGKYAEYNSYVNSCIVEGNIRKEELVKVLVEPIEPIIKK